MTEWLRVTLVVAVCFFLLAGTGIFTLWFWLTVFP